MALYCVKYKRKTVSSNVRSIVSRNKRLMLQGKCLICKSTKSQFEGEMHIPGMNFADPGTNLNKR